MSILDILFPKKKQEELASDWQNEGMLKLCKDYYADINERIQDSTLSVHGVWGYLRHIPRERETVGYSKNVYVEANKCFLKLYEYSIRKCYINNITYDEFLYTDWYHKETFS